MRSVLIKNMIEDLGVDSGEFTEAIPLPNVCSSQGIPQGQ